MFNPIKKYVNKKKTSKADGEKSLNEQNKYKKKEKKKDSNLCSLNLDMKKEEDIKEESKIKRKSKKHLESTKELINSASKLKLLKKNLSLDINKTSGNGKISNDKNIKKNNKKSVMILNCNFNLMNNKTGKKIKKRNTVACKKIKNQDDIKSCGKKTDVLKQKKIDEPNFPGYYNLMLVNSYNVKHKRPPESKFILTNYNFNQAIKYDYRSFWRIFFICLLVKQNILHTFFFKTDLELFTLRAFLLIFCFSSEFAFNALFYFSSKISDRYNYEGDNLIIFTFVNNLTITIFSIFVSFVLRLMLKYLINSRRSIENVIRKIENKMRNNKSIDVSVKEKEIIYHKILSILNILNYKIFIFIIVELSFMLFFMYYVAAFCAVYKSTQNSWLLDSFSSFLMTNLFDVFVAFIISMIYTTAIRYKIEILYKISLFLYNLGY